MHFFSIIVPFFLATVLFLSCVECDNLSPFGEKVNCLLPEDNKNKLFNQNYKSPDEIQETEEILPKNFTEAIGGVPLKPCRVERVNDAITDLLHSDNKNGLFVAYTNAIARTLEYLGKLNSTNVNEQVGKYVDELNQSAMTVPDDYSLIDTFPALVISQGRFLKSQGITKNDANQFLKYLTQEIRKATPKIRIEVFTTTPVE